MSATFTVLKALVASAIRDPDAKTFTDAAVGEMVNASLAEVARFAPEMFQEDITLVADTLEYVLRSTEFSATAIPEIEVMRVELWDSTNTPAERLALLPPAHAAYSPDSQAGWVNWGGTLALPRSVWSAFDGNESDYYLRVWGYSPFVTLASGSDTANVSEAQKQAVVTYCRLEALERLNADRELYTQWQTRSGNSDVSPAGLMNMLSASREEWRRKSRSLTRLRSQV